MTPCYAPTIMKILLAGARAVENGFARHLRRGPLD